jgi:hypothetical protein
MKQIEVTFRLTDGQYTFATPDRKIWFGHRDREKCAAGFIRLVTELARKGTSFRIEAYAPLGPALKQLRDAGAICRVGLQNPPPLKPIKWQMPGMAVPDARPPVFASWDDYLARTSERKRLARCRDAAKKANRKRLLSDAPTTRLTAQDVWAVIQAAKGRCAHCGSLAVENRPSSATGAPIPWAQVGRRIGSLEHVRWRYGGGGNDLSNLAWACLWCNTWHSERRPQALDHGGYYPITAEGRQTEPK